jgi:DNA polymerase-1
MAVNTVIQGSAADLLKLAMLELQSLITGGDLKAKMLVQVHDELIFEVPTNNYKEACEVIRQTMEDAVPISVPVIVDVEAGLSWGEMVVVDGKTDH